MKKYLKFFVIGLMLIFSVVCNKFGLNSTTTANADTLPTYEYVVSNDVNTSGSKIVTIKSKMNDGTLKTVSTASSFNLALDVIRSIVPAGTQLNIEFDNFETSATIELADKSYNISGTVISAISNEIFVINPTETSTINFKDFSLTAHNSQKLISIISNKTVSLTLDNVSLSSAFAGSKAIELLNENATILTKNNLGISTTIFASIVAENSLTFDSSTNIISTESLKILIPYSNTNFIVSSNVTTLVFNNLEFASQNNYYQINATLVGGQIVATSSLIDLTITFDQNTDASNILVTGKYGETITYPTMERVGYAFNGWFTDNGTFLNPYTNQTFEKSITLYAKWTPYVTIYFTTNGGTFAENSTSSIYGEANSPLTKHFPQVLREGYDFAGWRLESTGERYTDDQYFPNFSITLVAQWRPRQYDLIFITHTSQEQSQQKLFGDTITYPTLSREGYKFCGWFEDSSYTTAFNSTSMPSRDLNLYAKWEEKETVTLNIDSQSYEFDENYHSFNLSSTLNNFQVTYFVDGEWTSTPPTQAGTYNVHILRVEDETHKKFETTLMGGLTIDPLYKNLSWVIAVLFIVGFAEIIAAIFVRYMKKLKTSRTYVFSPISLLLANYIVPTNQIVLLAISGTFAVFGMVLLIYEIVSEYRTNPVVDIPNSDYDNRKHLKKIGNENDNFFTSTVLSDNGKTDKYSYSASDIEQMLNDPLYFEKHKHNQNKSSNDAIKPNEYNTSNLDHEHSLDDNTDNNELKNEDENK